MQTLSPQQKNEMVIKKINHNTIDCFLSEGWEQWGRFKIKFGKELNQLFQIKGIRFPKEELKRLEEKYNQKHS